jgi:Domain of unknown function (DUF4276)
MRTLLPIVEGDGDLLAVPELIRRVAHAADIFDLQILRPHKRGDLAKVSKRFEDFLAAGLLEGAPILWVMDYDGERCDDVDRDIETLRMRAAQVAPQANVDFAFMVKEYESLFLCDRETLCMFFPDIPGHAQWPADPERVRGAKEWISKIRPKGLAYKETVHQVRLTSRIDLHRLRDRSPSFVRFETAVLKLLG